MLALLGLAWMNVLRQIQGPQYSASASVFLTTTDLGAALTGVQPQWTDPARLMDNAVSLARSSELYERAGERIGRPGEDLRAIVTVAASERTDVLNFTATGADEDFTVAAVNAVAAAYPQWRAEVSGATIREAIRQLRAQIARSPGEQEALREQLDRLEVLETLNSGNTVLIESASGAAQISPRPVHDSILGALLGVVVGLLLAGVREVFNTRVRSETEVEAVLEVPVLATIASFPRRGGLVTLGRHEDAFADSYALLAANLLQLAGSQQPLVIAVTSAGRNEGKTMTAANLAVAFARRGTRVVLADFDVRRPTIATLFDLGKGAPGVQQVIKDGLDFRAALHSVELNGSRGRERLHIRRARVPESSVVAAGAPSPGGLRILPAGGAVNGVVSYSPNTVRLLDDLAHEADVVLLDTPPALATAEMAELSRLVDYVLLVVRQGQATRRSLRSLQRQARSWKTEIAGAVITDAGTEQNEYAYYRA